jgi:excisionase family DNA binding protein
LLSLLKRVREKKESSMESRLLSVKQIAEEMGCSLLTVRRKIYCGQLKSMKIGRLVRVRREDLEVFLAASAVSAGGEK